jgi:hypothetical protein
MTGRSCELNLHRFCSKGFACDGFVLIEVEHARVVPF